MNHQKIIYLTIAALLIGAGFFPLATYAFSFDSNRPPDGPSPLIYSVTWDNYDEVCAGYLVGTWRIQDVNDTWFGPTHPSTTLSITNETIALPEGSYDGTKPICDPGEFDEGSSAITSLSGSFLITAAVAATGAISIPTSTASTFLANISNQLSDLGTLAVLVLAISLTLVFWVIKKIIDVVRFDDEKEADVEYRAEKAMRRTDELLKRK